MNTFRTTNYEEYQYECPFSLKLQRYLKDNYKGHNWLFEECRGIGNTYIIKFSSIDAETGKTNFLDLTVSLKNGQYIINGMILD